MDPQVQSYDQFVCVHKTQKRRCKNGQILIKGRGKSQISKDKYLENATFKFTFGAIITNISHGVQTNLILSVQEVVTHLM